MQPNKTIQLFTKSAQRRIAADISHSTRYAALLLSCGTLLCVSAAAQVSGGSITGTLTDSTGAVISGAHVKITNHATSISQMVTSTSSGVFNDPNLPPGNYDLLVKEPGFREEHATAIVAVGRNDVLNLQLEVGAANATTVEVTSASPVVDLGSSALTQDVDGKTVRELPLNGRDWTSLSALEPGVHPVDNQVALSAGNNARANRGVGSSFTIGGNRPQQNSYKLDGITVNDYSGGGPGGALGLTLGVDAIQEFSVVTSNATAEYGRVSGGVISAVTRAGGNQFHGSAYEFIRNSALDATPYFATGTAPFKRNQFGGTIGGPILHNRTFFFFDYEGIRQTRSIGSSVTTPTASARTGNLHCTVKGVTKPCPVTVNPGVMPYFAIYPLPNDGSTGDTGSYTFTSSSKVGENFFTGRLDHNLSENDALHGTAQSDNSENTQPDAYDFINLGLLVHRKLFAIEERHSFTPSLLNFARVGYSRTVVIAPSSSSAINPLANDTSLGFTPDATVGEIDVPGLSAFLGGVNAEGTYTYHYNSYQASDDLYWTRGKHSIQAGASIEYIQANNAGVTTAGRFVFNSLADFLTASPASFTSRVPGNSNPIYLRQQIYGGYLQDSWRVRQNLTFSLGVRYEPTSLVHEKYGHTATLLTETSPTPKLGPPYYQNPTQRNISPRVGVILDPFNAGKTSIRAGFGVYDTLPLTYMFQLVSLNVAPYALNLQVGAPTLAAGDFPKNAYSKALDVNASRYGYIQQNPGRSYVEQYQLNVEQQLAPQTSLEIGYTGAHGVHQPLRSNDINIVQPIPSMDPYHLIWPTTGGVKINPSAGVIDALAWIESTNYNSMIAALRHSSKNVRLGVSYTFGKSIDESSSSISGTDYSTGIQAPFINEIGRFRGRSDFDITHNLVLSGLYNIEGPKNPGFFKTIGGGYQVSGIFRSSSGQPFTPTITGDPLGLGNANPFSFPDRIEGYGCSGNPVNIADKKNYLKRQCFAFPATARTFGNLQRNSINGPKLNNVDFSLVKNTAVPRISEAFHAEFRAEFFNILNHPSFAVPGRSNSTVFNAKGAALTPAVLTAVAAPERQIQFGLKLIF